MSSINDLDKLPKDVALNIIVKQLPSIPPTSQLVAFFALLLISIPLLIALAMTIIFGKRIRRHPVSYIFFLFSIDIYFYSKYICNTLFKKQKQNTKTNKSKSYKNKC